MSLSQIGQLYQELERGLQHDWLRDDPAAKLAGTLTAWAASNNLTLPPPRPALHGPERDLAPEL